MKYEYIVKGFCPQCGPVEVTIGVGDIKYSKEVLMSHAEGSSCDICGETYVIEKYIERQIENNNIKDVEL